jgi:hypothetical protein
MLFTTEESRSQYFEQCRLGKLKPSFGDALYHSRSVQLGLWSDSSELRLDVAHIFKYELIAAFPEDAKLRDIKPSHLAYCPDFINAFEESRAEPQSRLDRALNVLGMNVGNPALVDSTQASLNRDIQAPPDPLDLLNRVYLYIKQVHLDEHEDLDDTD